MNQDAANYIQHYGVLGMKWGVRKKRKKSSGRSSKKSVKDMTGKDALDKTKKVYKKKKTNFLNERASKLTDSELDARIARLEKEKRYNDLKKANVSRGKKIADNIIDKSIENIGTQAFTWVLGTAVNKATKKNIVNPKKGQKDKG